MEKEKFYSKLNSDIKETLERCSFLKEDMDAIVVFYLYLNKKIKEQPKAQVIWKIDDEELNFILNLKNKNWEKAAVFAKRKNSDFENAKLNYEGPNCYAIMKAIEGALL